MGVGVGTGVDAGGGAAKDGEVKPEGEGVSVGGTDGILTQLGTGSWSLLHFFTVAYSSVLILPHTMGGAFLAPDMEFTCLDTYTASNDTPHPPSTTAYPLLPPSPTNATPFTITITNITSITTTTASNTTNDECGSYQGVEPGGEGGEGGLTWVECTEFHFDNSTFVSTITSEFGLVCGHEYLRSTYQSMYMIGVFAGSPVNGFLADRYGRKKTLVFGTWVYLVVALGSAWLPYLTLILFSRFLLGATHAIVCFTGYVLAVEVAEPRVRTVVGFCIYIIWSLCMVVWGAVAYAIRTWRLLQLVATLPGLLLIPALWLLDESPRWLLVKGRWQEAAAVLRRASKWHRVPMPSDSLLTALHQTEKEEEEEEHGADKSVKHRMNECMDGALLLYKTRRLRTITLLLYVAYLVSSMVYFGLSLSGGNLSNNRFIYMGLTGLMELPAYSLTVLVVQRFGRRTPTVLCFLSCSVALFALAFIPKEHNWLVVSLALLGKMGITGAFMITIFFSSELFPTEVRSRGMSTSFMMSRIGSIISPFITDIVGSRHPWAPSVVFGCASLVATVAVMLLPETLGCTLKDTIADMEAQHSTRPSRVLLVGETSSLNKNHNNEDKEAVEALTAESDQAQI